MNHFRKTRHIYNERQKPEGCPFCKTATIETAIYKDEYIYIAPNLTKYDVWEMHDVEEHLLIMPNRHVESLEELDTNERLAIMDAAAKYEAIGYSVYARGKGYISRSVKHQHTHLIKVTNKKPNVAIFLRKPYVLIKK